LLKANGIIPADKLRPGPAIEVPDDEDEEAIASKIKALQVRLIHFLSCTSSLTYGLPQDKLAAVRRKTRRASNKIKKETKAETSFFLPGEVIDLT
jgi:hypothetical protein